MINVELKREPNESSSSLLRRFSRRLQGSNIIKAAKAGRFAERAPSYYKRKKSALTRLERRLKWERLKKLGLVSDYAPRQGSPRR
jgi:ribosomal protein S21